MLKLSFLTTLFFSHAVTYFVDQDALQLIEMIFFDHAPFWLLFLPLSRHADIDFSTASLSRIAKNYFFDHTSFCHAKTDLIDRAPFQPC
jgi:hypothetical protein